MSGSAEIARFIAALFASGIFWLMVLFFIERAWLRSRLPGALIMAVLVLTLSAIALFTVVDEGAWRVIASQTEAHGQD
jgi:hypothetical protein